MKIKHLALVAALAIGATACDNNKKPEQTAEPVKQETHLSDKYAEYTLTTDINHLSDNEKQMLPLLFQAADIMDGLFWQENYGDKNELMTRIGDNADIKKLFGKVIARRLDEGIERAGEFSGTQGVVLGTIVVQLSHRYFLSTTWTDIQQVFTVLPFHRGGMNLKGHSVFLSWHS